MNSLKTDLGLDLQALFKKQQSGPKTLVDNYDARAWSVLDYCTGFANALSIVANHLEHNPQDVTDNLYDIAKGFHEILESLIPKEVKSE